MNSKDYNVNVGPSYYVTEGTGGMKVSRTVAYSLGALVIILLILVIVIPLAVYFGMTCPEPKSLIPEPDRQMGNDSKNISFMKRLPSNVRPVDYVLSIKAYLPSDATSRDPNMEFKFEGNLTINLITSQPTTNITLNAHNINITQSSFRLRDVGTGEEVGLGAEGMRVVEEHQQVLFFPSRPLLSNSNYSLSLSYIGSISSDLDGFYRSSYVSNQRKHWIGVTQFQPTSARKALPCFDEPNFKANFSLSITHPTTLSAISNTPALGNPQLLGNGWIVTKFETTPKMSTYLLAFVISDFSYTEKKTARNITFRVWSTPSVLEQRQTAYAAQVGADVLDFFERNYFNLTKFPLPKQDMVAIPDFDAGAMENWGLVLYRENLLLYDDQASAAGNRQSIANVIAHELAHQWFGNLMTMKWWDDLWLHEGFATFLVYPAIDSVSKGGFHMEKQFAEAVHVAMEKDQLSSTHSLRVKIDTENTIHQIFDPITYEKGMTMARMLEFLLGSDAFKTSLNNFLQKYQYTNADADDLFEVMEQSKRGYWSGGPLSIKDLMYPWILQDGYPLVTVTRDYPGRSATVTQTRFLLSDEALASSEDDSRPQWPIPIWYQELPDNASVKLRWSMPNRTTTIPITQNSGTYLLVNPGLRGFYRVQYDERNWVRLIAQLLTVDTSPDVNWNLIEPVSRSQLISDSFTLAKNGLLEYSIPLRLSRYLEREPHYVPWSAAQTQLGYIFRLLSQSQSQTSSTPNSFSRYFKGLIQPTYHRVGVKKLHSDPDQVLDDVDPNLRPTVYCTGVSEGNESDWEFMWGKLRVETFVTEKWNLLYGLSCSTNKDRLNRLMDEAAISQQIVRSSETGVVFSHISQNSYIQNSANRLIVWDYMSNYWKALQQKLAGSQQLALIISSAIENLVTEAEHLALRRFVEENNSTLGQVMMVFNDGLAQTQNRITWLTTYTNTVRDWAESNTRIRS